uniref:Uncharacterized protein n=1 Tax=Cacopsylla melanoneura TaxID=428564 RepID=A0A8D9EFM7_9HEMI
MSWRAELSADPTTVPTVCTPSCAAAGSSNPRPVPRSCNYWPIWSPTPIRTFLPSPTITVMRPKNTRYVWPRKLTPEHRVQLSTRRCLFGSRVTTLKTSHSPRTTRMSQRTSKGTA